MKKIFIILMVAVMAFCFVGCNESKPAPELNISQMKAIFELATTKCYYHNVAREYEENVEQFLWWSKDKHFWIEYSGEVTLGIDVSKVDIKVSGTEVTITVPKAKVLDYDVDEITEDSFIIADDSIKITSEHQTEAVKKAQQEMLKAAQENTALLNNAQIRAQSILEQYILNVGSFTGVEYTIKWEFLEDTPIQPDSQSTSQTNE